MDRDLPQLYEDIFDESAAEDYCDYAEHNRTACEASACAMPQKAA